MASDGNFRGFEDFGYWHEEGSEAVFEKTINTCDSKARGGRGDPNNAIMRFGAFF